jgi:hypothetical protein
MKGAEMGSELGFYQGCYLVWNQMLQRDELKGKLPCVTGIGALVSPCRS